MRAEAASDSRKLDLLHLDTPADPSGYSPEGTVLSDIVDTPEEISAIAEIEGSTSDRLSGEAGLLPGIGIHELVFGVRNGQVINASFTHAALQGGRFNTGIRGAWYASLEFETSATEIWYHRTRDYKETSWPDEETDTFDDYLADFAGEFHDLREPDQTEIEKYLAAEPIPACYAEPQKLAQMLLERGANGIVYPSVRRSGGICVVCFRPALVYHVRRSRRYQLTFRPGKPFRPELDVRDEPESTGPKRMRPRRAKRV